MLHISLRLSLEKKRPSITRLKRRCSGSDVSRFCRLEKKRPSITRLKLEILIHGAHTGTPLEKKRPSITRLKHAPHVQLTRADEAWKEKTLDYEIETHPRTIGSIRFQCLEKKRPSITRLKLQSRSSGSWWKISQLEKKRPSITRLKLSGGVTVALDLNELEKKRPSITRLKHTEL